MPSRQEAPFALLVRIARLCPSFLCSFLPAGCIERPLCPSLAIGINVKKPILCPLDANSLPQVPDRIQITSSECKRAQWLQQRQAP